MTVFQIDISRELGAVMLWMETPCGLRPIIGWADIEGVREFAEMLLDFYNGRKEENGNIKWVADNLLRQALGDAECFGEQDD